MTEDAKNRVTELFMDLYKANNWIHTHPDQFEKIEGLLKRCEPKIKELEEFGCPAGFSWALLIFDRKDVEAALKGFKRDLNKL